MILILPTIQEREELKFFFSDQDYNVTPYRPLLRKPLKYTFQKEGNLNRKDGDFLKNGNEQGN